MNVWVCSDPRWFQIKGHVPALKDPKSCQSYLPGGFCRAEDGKPCDAVEYAPVVRGRWRRMGSYANQADASAGSLMSEGSTGAGIITGFQCTVCGEKWFTPEFRWDRQEQTPKYCHCGALMEEKG